MHQVVFLMQAYCPLEERDQSPIDDREIHGQSMQSQNSIHKLLVEAKFLNTIVKKL